MKADVKPRVKPGSWRSHRSIVGAVRGAVAGTCGKEGAGTAADGNARIAEEKLRELHSAMGRPAGPDGVEFRRDAGISPPPLNRHPVFEGNLRNEQDHHRPALRRLRRRARAAGPRSTGRGGQGGRPVSTGDPVEGHTKSTRRERS